MRVGPAILVAAFCIATVAPRTLAAPKDALPLGLDKLYWGMWPEEAKAIFPALPAPGNIGQNGENTAALIYSYAGCNGELTLHFYDRRLYRLRFERVRDSTTCRERIERELAEQYDTIGARASDQLQFQHLDLRSRVTTVAYSHFVNTFGDWIAVDLREAIDASGWRQHQMQMADQFHRRMVCQHVGVDIISAARTDGTTDPVHTPMVPDLNCEYPMLAMRLMEEGRVVLNAHFRSDGSVGRTEIVSTQRRYGSRVDLVPVDPANLRHLTAAAATILREKLRFAPATKNGVAVETERQIAVDFTISNPLPPGTP